MQPFSFPTTARHHIATTKLLPFHDDDLSAFAATPPLGFLSRIQLSLSHDSQASKHLTCQINPIGMMCHANGD
jgi:hypothetical protein